MENGPRKAITWAIIVIIIVGLIFTYSAAFFTT
jgi:hypothetical protein